MTGIEVKINGTSAYASANGKITSGMVGLPVFIEYDSSWSGLVKTACFRVGNLTRKMDNVGTYTTVPWEVMRNSGKPLEIGVEGKKEDGSVVIPTIWATVSTVLPGANATIPSAPNPYTGEVPGANGAVIDDSQISANTTWSSQKISDELKNSGAGGGGTGVDGTTFYPSVSADGVISWTNDGDKENPNPVNLVDAVISALPVYNGEVEPV